MSKGTRRVMGALFAAVLALVLVVCILCATFARYTTSSTGDSGAVSVELWDVRAEPAQGEETAYVKTTSLRPDYSTKYSDNNSPARTHTADPIALMTFKNYGSLAADISVRCEAGGYGRSAEVTLNWDDDFAGWGEGWKEDDGTNAYMQKIMGWVDEFIDKYFTRVPGFTKSDDDDGRDRFNQLVNYGFDEDGIFSIEFSDAENGTYTDGFSTKLASKDSVTVWAEITWMSHHTEGIEGDGSLDFSMEELSDAIDTIIGMYVESIGFTIEWEAVQASQTGQLTP